LLPAIETIGLTKSFRRAPAVKPTNLQVMEGAVYALMGPNGAGKTTLIKMLMNLIQPNAGQALMLGADARSLRGKPLEAIGYVSENQKLPDWMTVGMMLSYWRPFYPTWDKALERELVARFELPLGRKLKQLSRGVRMKAALASILAYRPRLIILDEPLSGLDPLVRNDLMEVLLELAKNSTIFISSHDLAEIENFASHVGYMEAGELKLSESMARVRDRFRKVDVVADGPLAVLPAAPREWTEFAADGSTARWHETSFDAVASEARIREHLGAVKINTSPMTLREVFLAMAMTTKAISTKARVADGKAAG
jgi:ABC-2 type transport system ATP-binding protein